MSNTSNFQICPESAKSGHNSGNLRGRVDILEQSLMEVVAYVRDEKLRRIKKNKKKQQELVNVDSPQDCQVKITAVDLGAVDEAVDEDMAAMDVGAVDDDMVAVDGDMTVVDEEMTTIDKYFAEVVGEVV